MKCLSKKRKKNVKKVRKNVKKVRFKFTRLVIYQGVEGAPTTTSKSKILPQYKGPPAVGDKILGAQHSHFGSEDAILEQC